MQALARSGSAYRAVREGFNARAGALSGYLARDGMPGDDQSLEGQFGYFEQFFRGEYDADFLRAPDLLGPITSFKPWPCAGHPQLFLTAIAELVRTEQVRPDDVTSIRIAGCSDLLPHQCEPLEVRAAPTHSIDAKVSIPFLIGKMLRHGTLTIDDFSPSGLRDEAAIHLAKRVEWRLDGGLVRGANGYGLGIVEVDHTDGRSVRAEVEYPLGHPSNPLTWEQIVHKFHTCLEAAAIDIGPRADRIVQMVEDLENLASARDVLEAVSDER
jgi:2-methylcitrate dehydratase PrpD